jgi:hypothetical protein
MHEVSGLDANNKIDAVVIRVLKGAGGSFF